MAAKSEQHTQVAESTNTGVAVGGTAARLAAGEEARETCRISPCSLFSFSYSLGWVYVFPKNQCNWQLQEVTRQMA